MLFVCPSVLDPAGKKDDAAIPTVCRVVCMVERPTWEVMSDDLHGATFHCLNGKSASVKFRFGDHVESPRRTHVALAMQDNINERKENLIQQASNESSVTIFEGVADYHRGGLLSEDGCGCSVYKVKVDMHIVSVAETADVLAFIAMMIDMDNRAAAVRQRERMRGTSIMSYAEAATRTEAGEIASGIKLAPGMHLPISVESGSGRVLGTLAIQRVDGPCCWGEVYTAGNDFTLVESATLERHVSIELNGQTHSESVRVGTLLSCDMVRSIQPGRSGSA